MLNLKIITPIGTICDTQIEKISLPSIDGQFMVLRNHAPIIALLQGGEVRYTTIHGEEHRNIIQGGFARVLNNNVDLCVEMLKAE